MISLVTFGNNKARSTLTVIAILVIVIFMASVALTAVFTNFLNSENSEAKTPTAEITTKPAVTMTTVAPRRSASTPTHDPTLTPTSTPTLSPTNTKAQTRTVTTTPDPYSDEKYEEFVSVFYGEASVDTEIPLYLRGWTVVEDGVLIIVMNLTARSEDDIRRAKQVNTLVTSGYAQAVANYDSGNIDGEVPTKLRLAEVNNTNAPSKTLYVNTSLARDYYSDNLNAVEFTEQYWNTTRNMTVEEKTYIKWMDRSAENVTLYNETAG